MADLSVTIDGVRFPNPVIVGSCSLTNDAHKIERLVAAGAGGIITKTISPDALPGPPRPFSTGRFRDSLAVSGDMRMTLEDGIATIRAVREAVEVPIIANVIGRSDDIEVWGKACRALEDAGAHMIELDLNGHPEGDLVLDVPANLAYYDTFSIGQDPEVTARVVAGVAAAVDIPVVSKLTLRAPNMLAVAKASADAGAAAISGVNTLHAVANVDVERRGAPALPGFETQSLTSVCGPDLALLGTKWTALVSKFVDRPYISGSGIATSRDVVERIMLGAYATAICSAIYLNGPRILTSFVSELERFMDDAGWSSLDELRGAALENFVERGRATHTRTVARVSNAALWAEVAEDVFERSELECRCIERRGDGIGFNEAECTGCALPHFHAPAAVRMDPVDASSSKAPTRS